MGRFGRFLILTTLAVLVVAPATASAKHARAHTHHHAAKHHRPAKHHRKHVKRAEAADATGTQLFAPDSVWNTPIAPDATVDPSSSAMVQGLANEVTREVSLHTGPGLGAAARSPIYTVGPDTPSVPVILDTGPWGAKLAQAFAQGVPIPADALPSHGSDGEMVVYQPSSDTMWEFFLMQQALHFPRQVGAARATTAGTLAPGPYHYWLTATNANGETNTGNAGITAKLVKPGALTFTWAPIDGATGYDVYRGTSLATAGLLATLPGDATSFTDTGAAVPGAATPPKTNTATTPGQWHAAFGGRIAHVSTNPGHYENVSDANGGSIESFDWGATASSLPLAAGMITKADMARGEIDHTLAIGLPNLSPATSLIAARRWAFPAQRSDGKSALATAIPEGARLRLDPSLDLDSVQMSPFTRMVATAAQRYGIIVQDGSAATVFYGEDPTPYMRAGEPNFFDQVIGPRKPGFLADFPWAHLQVMQMTVCTVVSQPCQ